MTAAIRADGLRKSFKGVDVLRGVTFAVESGSIFALLGSNGAGKTTTIRILTTLLRADSGTAWVNGHDVQAELQSGALVEVMPQHVAQPLPVTLLQPHRQHRAQRVQVFIEWLLPVLRSGLQLQ